MLASGSILLAVTFVALDCISPLDSECDKGNDREWLIAMLEHSRVNQFIFGEVLDTDIFFLCSHFTKLCHYNSLVVAACTHWVLPPFFGLL